MKNKKELKNEKNKNIKENKDIKNNKKVNEKDEKKMDINKSIEIDVVDEKGFINFLIRILKGIVIGMGAILPGVSGGALAVIFGIYEPAIKFISNLKHKFWKNVLFFIPAGMGLLLGVFLFSFLVEKAFGEYLAVFITLFLGFVAGTIPSLYRKAGSRGRSKSDNILFVVVAILLVTIMIFGQKWTTNIKINTFTWLFSGALLALGFIVPGLTSPNFLMYFGVYDKLAAGINSLDFSILIPLAIGGIISMIAFSALVNFLFKRYYTKVQHTIFGLVIGSSIAILPTIIIPEFIELGKNKDTNTLIFLILVSIVLFFIGAGITYYFSKLEEIKFKSEKNKIIHKWF